MSGESAVGYVGMVLFYSGAFLYRRRLPFGGWLGVAGFGVMIASIVMWVVVHVRIV